MIELIVQLNRNGWGFHVHLYKINFPIATLRLGVLHHLLGNITANKLANLDRYPGKQQLQTDAPISRTHISNFFRLRFLPFHETQIVVQDVSGVGPLEHVVSRVVLRLVHLVGRGPHVAVAAFRLEIVFG